MMSANQSIKLLIVWDFKFQLNQSRDGFKVFPPTTLVFRDFGDSLKFGKMASFDSSLAKEEDPQLLHVVSIYV